MLNENRDAETMTEAEWAEARAELDADCDVSEPFGELSEAYWDALWEACSAAIAEVCRDLLVD